MNWAWALRVFWKRIGVIIKVKSNLLELADAMHGRPTKESAERPACAWYKCPLSMVVDLGPLREMMRCTGCRLVGLDRFAAVRVDVLIVQPRSYIVLSIVGNGGVLSLHLPPTLTVPIMQ